jgi:hypothetical protein
MATRFTPIILAAILLPGCVLINLVEATGDKGQSIEQPEPHKTSGVPVEQAIQLPTLTSMSILG